MCNLIKDERLWENHHNLKKMFAQRGKQKMFFKFRANLN